MFKYHYTCKKFNDEKFIKTSEENHELNDKEIQQRLISIYKEYENIEYAVLKKVEVS